MRADGTQCTLGRLQTKEGVVKRLLRIGKLALLITGGLFATAVLLLMLVLAFSPA